MKPFSPSFVHFLCTQSGAIIAPSRPSRREGGGGPPDYESDVSDRDGIRGFYVCLIHEVPRTGNFRTMRSS